MPDQVDKKQSLTQFVWEEWKKRIAGTLFAIVLFTIAAWATPIGHRMMKIYHTSDQLDLMNDKIDDMMNTILELSGKNRVTEQPDGMSYVKEPVYLGEPISLVLFIGRTESGAGCILKEFIPQLTDENGVTLSEQPRRPLAQLNASVGRRVMTVTQPAGLSAGRTRINLQLEYLCGGSTVFELTKGVFFYTLEKPK